ncbi:MAG TPA: gamma carbonic anhydrase family protein, partial [Hyphomicrobiaceae bacterium]|nr:gamma carbonic anhydrase family protein [Hyphomicrobiaceae bacterium]
IGIGSIVLNGARIGANCLIGAHTLIPEGKQIPDGSVVMGSPGKIVRQVTEEDKQHLRAAVHSYVSRWPVYAAKLKRQD